jgi:alkyl hydroperoxide reductase subunit D
MELAENAALPMHVNVEKQLLGVELVLWIGFGVTRVDDSRSISCSYRMDATTALLQKLPEEAVDLVANAQRVLGGESLNTIQTWGCALASAYFIRQPELIASILTDAKAAGLNQEHLSDAKGAAALMGMNTVYFRFRHIMHTEAYTQKAFNLRMTRMQQVATDQTHYELYSIGPAALAGCELCLKAHEAAVKKGGLNEDNVHDAVRIASVLNGIAVALETL